MTTILENIWETIKTLPSLIKNVITYIYNSLDFLPSEIRIPFLAIISLILGIFIYRLIR